jgi:hypothetical protein
MEIFISSAGTQVKGGRQKNTSKGKGKLKDKTTKPPSFDLNQDTFVEVPLSQNISFQTIKDMRRERMATTP